MFYIFIDKNIDKISNAILYDMGRGTTLLTSAFEIIGEGFEHLELTSTVQAAKHKPKKKASSQLGN